MSFNIDKHVEEHRLMAIRYSDKTVVTACPADFGSVINCSVTKTTPADADQIGLMDSAASNTQKKLSWANVKATLNAVYARLAGAAGGQTLIGGTAAGDSLTLLSTSNATKGAVIFGTASEYDQVNDRIGVGTLTPGAKIHALSTTEQLRIGYDASNYLSCTVSSGGIPTLTPTGNALIINGDIRLDKTVTSGGTAGAQTINKTCGSVNFAALDVSLVVTNSLVTTSSVIVATVATADTTMTSVIAVAAAGSFTLTANSAATAETRVNFIVVN